MKELLCAAALASLAACASPPATAEPPAAQAPAVRAAFASDRILVTVRGDGPDVILIPGLSSGPAVWADTVKAHPGHRFHLVQLKGFAGAPAEGNAQGVVSAPVAEEVARYIQAQGLQAPALIGHSMGGTVAMMVAARHPERAGRVMVVDMLPWMGVMFGPPGSTPDSVRPVADQIRDAIAAPPSPEGEAMLKQTISGMIKTESRRAGALADARASDPDVSARAFHELITTDLRPELPRIAAPLTVLYVNPQGSPMSDAQMEAGYAAAYDGAKGARLARIPDSWHFIMFDQPERFQAEVRTFLAAR